MKDLERGMFRHTTQVKVRNYEIDWQGIVHNAVYLQYFEVGRISYLEQLGIHVDIRTIQHESRIVVVRNEINYRSPARFGERLTIATRISYIRNSSFAFEGLLEDAAGGRLVAENVSVHVWLDNETLRPRRVPDEFRSQVRQFEGEHLSMHSF